MIEEAFDILVIDDKKDIGESIKDLIEEELHLKTQYVLNASAALKILEKANPKVIILDIWLEGSEMDGLGLLKTIKENYKDISVIVISDHGNVGTVVKAIKLGAYNFIEKPFKSEKLVITVKRTLENTELQQYNTQLKKQNDFSSLIGKSKKINSLKNKIANNHKLNSRIMIYGEIGTGKEKVARLLHNHQCSGDKPFYKINIGNYSEEELDRILFGILDTPSIFEKEKRSTIYLSQIFKLSTTLQKKLLRFISSLEKLDQQLKLICSSTLSYSTIVAQKKFNLNLLNRLSTIIFEIPPIRERKEDIRFIVDYYINNFRKDYNIKHLTLDNEFYAQFLKYNWPGNILEIKVFVETLLLKVLLQNNKLLRTNNLILSQRSDNINNYFDKSLKNAKQLFEKDYIEFNLYKCNNNITHTARLIGMERTALHKKINNLNIKLHN